ncbi:MAG: serine/threonine protein phosphatase [Bacteroidia bacterium]|nr:serine/threonine protein phosphatase [Bacteroidia bacterium]MDW8302085.1 metallophosphoesterase family protein [Bacteroidia bacterium]
MSLRRFELNTPFRYGHFVQKNEKGRRLVIPDIHGCKKTFEELLKKINLTKDDQLFLLGDYVNKGPDSLGVIDKIIELIEEGYNIFPLRGNHEQIWLEKMNNHPKITQKQKNFLRILPLFYELDRFYLVHGGFDIRRSNPFLDIKSMLTARYMQYDARTFQNKIIIHGHTTMSLPIIQAQLQEKRSVISLDNGCVYRDSLYEGNLVCLNLDTFELAIQRNVENTR